MASGFRPPPAADLLAAANTYAAMQIHLPPLDFTYTPLRAQYETVFSDIMRGSPPPARDEEFLLGASTPITASVTGAYCTSGPLTHDGSIGFTPRMHYRRGLTLALSHATHRFLLFWPFLFWPCFIHDICLLWSFYTTTGSFGPRLFSLVYGWSS